MRTDLHRYLIAYDIPDDRRRVVMANTLSAYGDRVQYSVFLVDTPPIKIARLRRALEKIMVPSKDSVLICDVGPTQGAELSRFIYIGVQRHTSSSKDYIV